MAPATSGITTNRPTESVSVSQGTITSETPSSIPAMGAKAKTMIRSFTETCTRV